MNTTKTTKQDGEYRVRLFVDGIYQAGADYFTTDKQDAKDTADKMELNGVESDKTTDFAIDEQADFDAENDLVMYDVCNDYSLSPITTEFDPKLYKTRKHDLGMLYIHKEYNEVHYLKAKAGLDGQYI
jgi:hypothetical protein